MPKTHLADVEIYYELAGTGPRLLFISGTGGDLRQRPGVFDGPLSSRFEVLAYDQRGLGQSSVPPGPYSMADYGRDAAGLMDHVGWASAAVVGVSFGGMVAQELALSHPEKVDRLVLACTSSGGTGGASYPLHELASLGADERVTRSIELADTRVDAAWREANPDRWSALLEPMRARASTGASEPGREAGARLQLEARSRHDTWDRLGTIVCPTFVCGGRYDGIAPPANVEKLAGAIPGAQLELFEGGHMFLLQDRSAFPAIERFLAGRVGS